jgi:hypothetical protein
MLTKNHYLMHCRPRLEFHLGHVQVLGKLHRLLVEGHRVTVLVIPYDEHEAHNRTFQCRLREDVELTKAFYRSYLGFESRQLEVISTYDFEIIASDIEREHAAFQEMYCQADTVRRLVDVHGRTWASTQTTFIAKCIASIRRFTPTHTICGHKHQLISAAFKSLLERNGTPLQVVVIEDFLDLTMRSAMDNKDTAHTVVEVTDNDDFIFHKLRLQHDRADGKLEDWLDHFVAEVLTNAPARLTQGVQRQPRSTAEKEIALTKFLANVRRLIPYVQQSSSPTMDILFNGTYSAKQTQKQIARYSELIRRLYGSETIRRVEVSREYTDGASPTNVFELRERSTEGGDHVTNVSVLKFGDPYDLNKERSAFESIVRASRTAGFAEIKGSAGPYEGLSAIRYQSADYFMGTQNKNSVAPLRKAFADEKSSDAIESNLSVVFKFLDEHVYPTLWSRASRRERATLGKQYNVFLPARFSVFVDSRDPGTGEFRRVRAGDTQTLLAMRLQIAEYHSDLKRVRAYTTDSGKKVDIFYDSLGEGDTQEFREGNVISVQAEVRKQRRDTFDRAISDDASLIDFLKGRPHPEEIAEKLLSTEFDEIFVGPVHGDLHSGNIITNGSAFCVIDYGKTSADGLIAHDIALLLSDLYLRTVGGSSQSPPGRGILALLGILFGREPDDRGFNLLEVLRYEMLSTRIKRIVSEPVFWAALSLTFLGSLKFSLSANQRRHSVLAAYHCFEKVE